MYTGLLHSHNMFRWLLLIVFLTTIAFAITSWLKKSEWKRRDNISGLLLVIIMDIQFVLGVILYAFVSPITKAAFSDFGAAMKNSELRFYAIEHILMIVIALVLVHIGRVKSKSKIAPWKRHRASAIYYTISLLLILAAIPWERALF